MVVYKKELWVNGKYIVQRAVTVSDIYAVALEYADCRIVMRLPDPRRDGVHEDIDIVFDIIKTE